jgi:PPOX class probable F420-dependent enzyme
VSGVVELSEDVVRFLTERRRTGKLGYTASDGRPLVAPVWFIVENGEIVFNTGAATAKGRAIVRDPRVVLCVDMEEWPFGFVQVQGIAVTDDDPDELYRTAAACGARYAGPDRADEFGKRNGVPGELVVRIQPTKVITLFDATA